MADHENVELSKRNSTFRKLMMKYFGIATTNSQGFEVCKIACNKKKSIENTIGRKVLVLQTVGDDECLITLVPIDPNA